MTLAATGKIWILFAFLPFLSCKEHRRTPADLNKTAWILGSDDCSANTDPPVQVVQYDQNSWIPRESKCISSEAPLMFLFFGQQKALLMDAVATFSEVKIPLRGRVDNLVGNWEKAHHAHVQLIVAHTHSHGDHTAADIQFKNHPSTTVAGLKVEGVISFFKLESWPLQSAIINLGDRILEIIPIPGHYKTSIAAYDNLTKILLTGNSFYPGRLYVSDWQACKLSTQRLIDFTAQHKITYILGNCIEMSATTGRDYPLGTTFQPDEHILPLKVEDVVTLNNALKELGDKLVRKTFDNFIIYQVN